MTIPEFYEKRFSRGVRIFGGLLLALAGILNMGLFLKAGALFVTGLTGLTDPNSVAVVMTVMLAPGDRLHDHGRDGFGGDHRLHPVRHPLLRHDPSPAAWPSSPSAGLPSSKTVAAVHGESGFNPCWKAAGSAPRTSCG